MQRSGDVKVVLLGPSCAGKTALTVRLLHNRFDNTPHQNTVAAAFGRQKIQVDDGRQLMISIWDTAGCEQYRAISRQFYRNAFAAILCYDLTVESSWEHVKSWVCEIQKMEPDCRLYFCGTKLDLIRSKKFPRRVQDHQLRDFIAQLPNKETIQIHETSSKSGEGVSELFRQIAADFLELEHADGGGREETIIVGNAEEVRKKCAC